MGFDFTASVAIGQSLPGQVVSASEAAAVNTNVTDKSDMAKRETGGNPGWCPLRLILVDGLHLGVISADRTQMLYLSRSPMASVNTCLAQLSPHFSYSPANLVGNLLLARDDTLWDTASRLAK